MIYEVEDGVIPNGIYTGKLIEIIEIKAKYGLVLKFFFQIDSCGGVIISGMCGAQRIARGTRAYDWLQVLHGTNLGKGQQINVKNMIGSVAEIRVENVEKDGKIYSNVVGITRLIVPAQDIGTAPAGDTQAAG